MANEGGASSAVVASPTPQPQAAGTTLQWMASDHSASLLGQLEMLAFGYIKYGRIKYEGRWGAP
jgi:hypothetical protein